MTSDPGSMMLPPAQRPGDQVPNPNTPVGMLEQEALRDGDMSVTIRETIESVNKHGEEVTTVIMQDGSKSVMTKHDPFDRPSKQNFVSIVAYDKNGSEVAESSSWHDYGNDCAYTFDHLARRLELHDVDGSDRSAQRRVHDFRRQA
jgi:hypothetical protein